MIRGASPQSGAVIWLTGLSGAGKSTIASAVFARLIERGVRAELLDGDIVRSLLPTGFSREDREAHIKRVGFLASRLEHHGVAVVCALISPYEQSREWVREQCQTFLEIYVSTPLDVCEARDVKGLYRRARAGELTQFTGIDDPYEPPRHPAATIDASIVGLDDAVGVVIGAWERQVPPA